MSRELFMLFLVLASVLGGVMGACLWAMRRPDGGGGHPVTGASESHRLDGASRGATARYANEKGGAPGPDVTAAEPSPGRSWQPPSVDRHAEAQSRRIVSLVAELQAAEEQQMRLQRDLATLRASRQYGGETVHPHLLDGEDDVPVLNRRVSAYGSGDHSQRDHRQERSLKDVSGSELLGLSLALDSTAEVPVMSEEELAESIDELELEFIGEGVEESGGNHGRG